MRCSPRNGSGDLSDAVSIFNFLNEVEVPEEAKVKVPREQEYGVRNPRKLQDPRLPSRRDVEEYNLTHLPYRSWCPFCVAGEGKMAPRFKQLRVGGLPEIHLDYCFMSTEGT